MEQGHLSHIWIRCDFAVFMLSNKYILPKTIHNCNIFKVPRQLEAMQRLKVLT